VNDGPDVRKDRDSLLEVVSQITERFRPHCTDPDCRDTRIDPAITRQDIERWREQAAAAGAT
jgi:hypothetical protein